MYASYQTGTQSLKTAVVSKDICVMARIDMKHLVNNAIKYKLGL